MKAFLIATALMAYGPPRAQSPFVMQSFRNGFFWLEEVKAPGGADTFIVVRIHNRPDADSVHLEFEFESNPMGLELVPELSAGDLALLDEEILPEIMSTAFGDSRAMFPVWTTSPLTTGALAFMPNSATPGVTQSSLPEFSYVFAKIHCPQSFGTPREQSRLRITATAVYSNPDESCLVDNSTSIMVVPHFGTDVPMFRSGTSRTLLFVVMAFGIVGVLSWKAKKVASIG